MFVNYSKCKKGDLPCDLKYFTDVCINEIKCLPDCKPPIDRLVFNDIRPTVTSIKLVETPVGFSNAGQNLSGNKLVLEISLDEMCKYIVDSCEQTVYIAYFENTLKSVFIVVPEEINGNAVCELIRKHRYNVNIIVEKTDTTLIDSRCFRLWASLLVYIDFI
ncbi:MAG: hypothetical protein ACRCWM_07750 [Sarcina sp.]|uniref:hypothetical protein n=1 Tax=Clostridium sp. TaxID=1506 RepID=UPI003F348427